MKLSFGAQNEGGFSYELSMAEGKKPVTVLTIYEPELSRYSVEEHSFKKEATEDDLRIMLTYLNNVRMTPAKNDKK